MRLWRRRSSLIFHSQTFSICRAHYGAGALHLGVAMAVYLGRVWKHSVALIEMSPDERLLSVASDNTVIIGDTVGFHLGEIDVFPGCDNRSLGTILGGHYEYTIVIYSFGTDEPLLPSDTHRLCISSARPWYLHDATAMMRFYLSSGYGRVCYLAVCPTHHEKIQFQQEFGVHLDPIPYIDDPFSPDRDDMDFLRKLTRCG